MAILCGAMMTGYAVFRHVDELPLEYPMLALGVVLAATLLRMQRLRYLEQQRRQSMHEADGTPASSAASTRQG
jgi:hypothetical protein